MSRLLRISVLGLGALAFTLGAGCSEKNTQPRVLGQLVELIAGQASSRSSSSGWSPAQVGATFFDGDALRTAEESEARLKFAGEFLRMGPETTIFFGARKLDFEGEIEVGVGFAELGIDFGDAEITTTGTVKLYKTDRTLRFEVLVGQATVTERGTVSTLQRGQELMFELGSGTIEKITKIPVVDAGSSARVDDSADAAPMIEGGGQVTAKVAGKDVRMRGGADESWVPMAEGDHDLKARAEVQLKGQSTVVLTRGAEKVTLSGPGLAVISETPGQLIELKKGRAAARSTTAQVVIAVPGGSIQLHAGERPGHAEIEVGRKGAVTNVVAGKVTLRSGDEVDNIATGDSAVLSGNGIEVVERVPTEAHITLKDASGVTLHAHKTPANLRVDFSEHCARGTVEVARRRSFSRPAQSRVGEGAAIISLTPGSHRYRVRCFEGDALAKEAVMDGKIAVTRDSGTRPLPPSSPQNTVDADGRRYTVLFQNRPPAMHFRWPSAPAAKSYQLHVAPARGKAKVSTSSKPEKNFSSGSFGEGNYEYWFSAGSKLSKRSRLTIAFDNAAATGYLSSPRPGAALDGGEVRVAGAAVSGWKVFVGDKELSLDSQYRFDQMVPVGAEGIAVRFSHPRYGTHYYLRRK